MKKTTLRDLAAHTGYALMTVSNAFTGRGRIADDTKNEILAVAKKLGYVPDMSARALRSGKSGLIALVLDGRAPDLKPWISEIQRSGGATVVFLNDKTFSLAKLAGMHPDGTVWFGKMPRNAPVKMLPGKGKPQSVIEKLLAEE